MAHPALTKLEKTLKKPLMAGLRRASVTQAVDPPDWGARPHRVLYLRYDRIGDMLMATGLLRAIATSQPGIEVDVLASKGNASVLDGNPYVQRILLFDRRSPRDYARIAFTLRRQRYDAVIDGMVFAPSLTMMYLMRATGAPYRIGVAGRANESFFNLPVPPAEPGALMVVHAGQTALPFGVRSKETDWRYDLYLRDDELARGRAIWDRHPGRPRILVNVSSSTPNRLWPAERFAAVIRYLREAEPGCSILVTSDPKEASVARAAAAAGGATAVDVSPVREAFALVAAADGLLTPDTSLAHAAAATGTPMAVLFRGGWIAQAPYGGQLVSIVTDELTVAGIPVESVLAAMPELLQLARQRVLATLSNSRRLN